MGFYIVTGFKLLFLVFTIPATLIHTIMNNFRLTSKGEVMGIIALLWVLSVGLTFSAGNSMAGLFSFYLFFSFIVTIFIINPDDEMKEALIIRKEERKITRLNRKEGRKSGSLTQQEDRPTGKYDYSEITDRIENTMVGSGFYKAEDFDKNPNYFLQDFYKVTTLEDNGDFTVTFKVPAGKRSSDFDRFEEVLPVGLDYHSAKRYTESGQTAGEAKFEVYAEEPETSLRDFSSKVVGEGIFPANKYLDDDEVIDLRNIPIGVLEDKNDGLLYINAFQNHYLIGGSTGGGKSVTGAMMACQIAKTNAIMYGIDLKQVELGMFSDRFASIAESHEEASIMLDGLIHEMTRRNTYLKAKGATKLDINDPQAPPIVLLVDEYAELMLPPGNDKASKDLVTEIDKKVRSLSQLSRNASFTIIIMTQSPKADIINTQLRNNLMNRIGLFTQNTIQLQTIIGEDANNVELIKLSEQAGWFVGGKYNQPVKFKTIYLEDDERVSIIRKYKGNRRTLSSKTMEAFEAAAWNRFVYRLVEMSDAGMGTLERIKDTRKLANELSSEDGRIIYGYITESESFSKIMAEHYGGYGPLDDFIEEYDKKINLTK